MTFVWLAKQEQRNAGRAGQGSRQEIEDNDVTRGRCTAAQMAENSGRVQGPGQKASVAVKSRGHLVLYS